MLRFSFSLLAYSQKFDHAGFFLSFSLASHSLPALMRGPEPRHGLVALHTQIMSQQEMSFNATDDRSLPSLSHGPTATVHPSTAGLYTAEWKLLDFTLLIPKDTRAFPSSTAPYAAPEVLRALESGKTIRVDTSQDIWARGVLLYESFGPGLFNAVPRLVRMRKWPPDLPLGGACRSAARALAPLSPVTAGPALSTAGPGVLRDCRWDAGSL
jgi:serine/threonine protein kinase